ncbi:archaeal flagella assembly protein J [Candidatus Methanoperedens nitroreducens]|uniref:Archaeal flagella assembly protein J n=1 Tax=Candidatus Methanoperedens nitratireducens TaxID=1392998 RepID=A0A062VA34_9EURY|nr:type II secretion system F family protein [Candidatus Methanoperedens nitroreducens]KCZ72584.1 archaeal flagella assembly protein J [Candidatus Methanoperedens nitroreducens]MDJ1423484.1 type II secretion system F family protein [Candidatus Methanoperedens sp.]
MSSHSLNRTIELSILKLKRLPFVLLGDRMKAHHDRYRDLRMAMRQARIPISYEMYISNAIFYSMIAGIAGALIGLIIAYIVVSIVGLPERITHLTFSPSTSWLLQYRDISIALFITIFLTALFGGITYMLFLVYPSFRAGERKGSIDKNLPYAVTFMYALSRGGMNVIEILRSLSKCTDTYDEAAREVDVILRDMDYFGSDLRSALHNICEITPSEKFRDLMYNLLTVIDSGGDIPAYFRDKSEQYLNRAKVEQKGFLETLGLIAESYVTAFVAGPLFIIILGVMMSVMGSGSNAMIYAIIYAVIPIGSVMFVVMVSIITPGTTGEAPLLPTESLVGEIVIPETREKPIFFKFIKSRDYIKIKKILRDPLKPLKEKPVYSLILSVPVALIYLVISIVNGLKVPNFIDYIDDKVIFTVYIIIIPLLIFHEYKKRREDKIQSQIPDFLKKLASTNETGMTLRDSIKLMTRSDIGMSKEIKKIWNDIEWGLAINEALKRFANRVRTHIVARSVTLLTKANESSGDVGEVLTVAARDAAAEQELKNERRVSMFIYIVIIYISFLVFIGIIYIISTTFLGEMVKAGERITSSGSRAVPLSLSREMLGTYNRIFFHGALIQGFSSGLIAGVMGEGSVLSGLKHSVIMVTIGYALFTLFVL